MINLGKNLCAAIYPFNHYTAGFPLGRKATDFSRATFAPAESPFAMRHLPRRFQATTMRGKSRV
jgi:hypothetical protein